MTQSYKPLPYFKSEMLSKVVENKVEDYLLSIKDQDPENLYRQIIDLVEEPLLKCVMEYTRKNKSRAANCLGINLPTLKAKLKRHGLS